jgi:hypothetical protein
MIVETIINETNRIGEVEASEEDEEATEAASEAETAFRPSRTRSLSSRRTSSPSARLRNALPHPFPHPWIPEHCDDES